jgi:hypothetical protein
MINRLPSVLTIASALVMVCSVYSQTTYNIYFGDNHSHTWYSDGGKDQTPISSYPLPVAYGITWARNHRSSFDFLGISDHNHNESTNMTLARWRSGVHEADSVNQDGNFIGMYGQEWGTLSTGGHVLVYGTVKLFGWNPGVYDVYVAKGDYAGLYTAVKANNGYCYLAHPQSDDFDGIFTGSYNANWDSVIRGVAVKSGYADSQDTTETDPIASNYEARYHDLLKKGYHVGPIANQDNHYTTFGRSNQQRTGLLATSLTKANVDNAFRNRRVYATEDHNLQVRFEIGSHVMGEIFSMNGSVPIRVKVTDPDGETITRVEVRYGIPGSTSGPTTLQYVTNRDSLVFSQAQPTGTTYYYYAYVTEIDGHKAWTAPMWVTTTSGPLPGAFVLLSPTNNSTNREVSDTLRWRSSTNATSYDVYLGTSNPPTTKVSADQTDTTYQYSDLINNTKYYWKIVAKNSNGTTDATGSPWNFTTIPLPPGSFNLLSPSSGATNQAISGTLSWQTSPNATGYDVYLSTANPPLTKISSNQTGTSYSYSGLNNSTMYYWKVVARNSVDTLVASGSPRNFTTVIAPPSAFTLVSPSDGALDQPLSRNLLWTSSANVSSFDLYMSTTAPPTTKIDSNITDTSYIRNGLSGGTTYYWKVVAKNQGGSTVALNAPRSFTTANLPISVSNLATTNITSTSIQLSWTDRATNEDGYRVYRASAPDSPFVQVGSDLPSNTESFLDTALNVNQRYYYKILPFNAIGEGDYMTLNAATLAAVPAAPELTNASYLSLLVTINPSSNPSSTQFAIQISADAVVKYLQVDGMLGAVPQWRSYTDWGAGAGITIRSLEACKQYTVQTKARNLDDVETAYSIAAQESTLCFVAENSLNRGWNLVSLPVTVSNSTKASLFPSSSSSAFYYQTGYKATDTLLNGVGYWLKFSAPETRAIQGNPRMPDTISLNHGWNIIGSTSYPFSIDSIVEEPPGVVTSDYFGYKGNYVKVDSVLPMRAYWVKASSIGKLIFVSSSNLPKKVARANHKTMLSRLNTLTFEDNMGHRQTLYFGNVGTTEIPLTVFELPPPPPSGAFDVRFASQRFVEMFMADQQEKNEFPITIQSAAYPITVSWNLSGDKEVSYKINTGVSTKTLEPTGRMIIEKGETQITLTVGAAESASRPKEFALHQNYPNPFNPSTEIHYEFPTASRVRLTIYNILGVSVTTLVDNVQDAGYHKVTWQPVDASGLYFYRLEATNVDNPVQSFQQVKRMMLLK